MARWINDGLHEAAQGIRSFLLVGQSNMAGRGDLTPENTITALDCFMLRMGRWQPMSEPINVDRAVAEGAVPRSGANLAASFAAQLQKETGAKIGLIPCADGGTRISQWQPDEVLFDHAVFQAKLAMRTSALTAILWHQGESDSTSAAQAATYLKRLRPMMRLLEERIRTVAQEMGMPNAVCDPLPIIVAELGDYLDDNASSIYHRQINEQLHAFAALDPAYACVTAHDLPDRGDCLHFDVRAQRRLGLRYACAWMDVTQRLQSKKAWRPALNPEQV